MLSEGQMYRILYLQGESEKEVCDPYILLERVKLGSQVNDFLSNDWEEVTLL